MNTLRTLTVTIAATLFVSGAAFGQVAMTAGPAPSARVRALADGVTAQQLRAYLKFIASEDLEGRATPSRGLDLTARFLAAHLERWGYRPAGDDGSFFQKVPLWRSRLDPDASSASLEGRAFKCGEGFLAGPAGGRRATSPGTASGALLYGGFGWRVKGKDLDPFNNLDAKGRILLFQQPLGALPPGLAQTDLKGKEGEDWESPLAYAKRAGAAGIAWIPTVRALAAWSETQARQVRPITQLAPTEVGEASIPEITVGPALLQALLAGERENAEMILGRGLTGNPAEPFLLRESKRLRFTVAVRNEMLATQNVVAILEGSDPALKREFVALGAHYDHLGAAENGGRTQVFPGADDDGSGTAALLAMAEASAHAPRLRRSLLFVWHAGEERGLWGSRHFTTRPTVPLGQVVAQLNVDMIGRSRREGDTNTANATLSGPDEIYVIGSRMMSSVLGSTSDAVNAGYLNLKFNFQYDDPKDPNRFFFRSDHVNYARKGISIIFYFNGIHEDYHKTTDTVDKIDFSKLERVARTVCATAATLAEADSRPLIDRELPAELR